MEQRRAVVAAATASLTLLAGAAAISLNTGIIGASGDDGVGHISPVVATTPASTPGTSVAREDPGNSARDDEHEDDWYENDRSASDHDAERAYEGADDDD